MNVSDARLMDADLNLNDNNKANYKRFIGYVLNKNIDRILDINFVKPMRAEYNKKMVENGNQVFLEAS